MKKKAYAYVLGALLSAALLSACGGSGSERGAAATEAAETAAGAQT